MNTCIAAAVVTLFASGPEVAWAYPAMRLLGTGDQVPGREPGVVFDELAYPQLEGDWVIAYGYSGPDNGIYAYDGATWQVVVDEATPLPGSPPSSQTVVSELIYDIDSGGLACFNALVGNGVELRVGLWAWLEGVIYPVVISGDPIPEIPGGIYDGPVDCWVKNGQVLATVGVEVPLSQAQRAVVAWRPGESPSILAGLEFGSVGNLWLGAESFLIKAIVLQETGIYRQGLAPGAPLEAVHGPGPALDFTSYGRPVELNDELVLYGRPPGRDFGIYRFRDGEWEVVLDQGSVDPHTGEIVGQIWSDVVGAGDRLGFKVSRDPGPFLEQLYLQEADRSFVRLAAEGELFEEGQVFAISYLAGAMDHDRLAVGLARSTDVGPDSAVWVFDLGQNPLEVPALGWLGLLALAVSLAVVAVGRLIRYPDLLRI